ncbi:MAG TPA: carboxypeptidase-like regulatory domain-containing protein [Bryobacteraceae bacterium]|nr:carboxypeptidase-like regulatory domain-containing protein [Bryobacteraceae bacterium]
MSVWERQLAVGLLGLAFLSMPRASAAPAVKFSGSIEGLVRDNGGVAQMGAAVLLFNRYDRLIRQSLTNERGIFAFGALSPDLYTIRVTLASFVPAVRKNIMVQPGLHSVLTISLASALSSIELMYAAPVPGTLMSDDWKWVLRSSQATRPVLRLVDYSDPQSSSSSVSASRFSDTRGVVKVSAGDAESFAGISSEPDLGTAFALATSLFGRNQLQVSGNLGYAARAGLPAAGFRTSFIAGEEAASSPEVTVTMRQLYLPGTVRAAGAGALMGQSDNAPALRTMSVSFVNHKQLTDDIRMDYGVSLDSVSLVERLNYFSPFARLTYELGDKGAVQLAYSSGAPPTELFRDRGTEAESNLQQDIASLGVLPRVSLIDDHVRVQRTQNYEIGYEKVSGARRYNLAAFHESVSNAAVTMLAPGGFYSSGDLLPDLSSDSAIFNIGHFTRSGYLASVTQNFSDRLEAGVAYGSAGEIAANRSTLTTSDPNELRSLLHEAQHVWASARISGTLPRSGTQIGTSYGWTDPHSLVTSHFYLTQKYSPQPGWNVSIRQPLPSMGSFGRLEATADLCNLLAQGYLPMTTAAQQHILLVHAPRAFRGGLSFIF